MPKIDPIYPEGNVNDGLQLVRARYDFARNGGTVGTKALLGSSIIPAGAYIVGGFIEVLTAVTSGGAATVAVQVEGAGDIVPATGKASWTTGLKKVVPDTSGASDLSASTAVKTTAARDVSVVIGTAALTAGKFDVWLYYTGPLA